MKVKFEFDSLVELYRLHKIDAIQKHTVYVLVVSLTAYANTKSASLFSKFRFILCLFSFSFFISTINLSAKLDISSIEISNQIFRSK